MGFKQRERKRKKRVAMANSQKKARQAGKSHDWWLTIVRTKTCCARCAKILEPGREMVYRAEPREARCCLCAMDLKFKTSVRWESRRAGQVKRRAEKAAKKVWN